MRVEPFITLITRNKSQYINPGVLLDWIVAEEIEGEIYSFLINPRI